MIQSEAMNLSVHDVEFQLAIPAENDSAQRFRKLFQDRGQYEAVMAAILAKLLQALPDPTFVDMGAFLGYYTCYAAKLLHGRAMVYAVESNPDYVSILNRAVLLNNLDNVHILHAALSDRIEPLLAVDNTVVADDGETKSHAITATTFDALCRETGLNPTIAKMDVHGFEGRILGGMEETLRHSLQFLLLELHPNNYLRRYAPGISRMQILDQLEDAGFHNYYVAGHRYTWSDGMQVFFDTGRFAYQPLSRENRGMLLFDRHNHIFVLSSKVPLEPILGPSALDPSLE
jgi:FkbM family methyltransferase